MKTTWQKAWVSLSTLTIWGQLGLLVLLVPSVEVPDFQLDNEFRNFLLWVDVHTDSHPST